MFEPQPQGAWNAARNRQTLGSTPVKHVYPEELFNTLLRPFRRLTEADAGHDGDRICLAVKASGQGPTPHGEDLPPQFRTGATNSAYGGHGKCRGGM